MDFQKLKNASVILHYFFMNIWEVVTDFREIFKQNLNSKLWHCQTFITKSQSDQHLVAADKTGKLREIK